MSLWHHILCITLTATSAAKSLLFPVAIVCITSHETSWDTRFDNVKLLAIANSLTLCIPLQKLGKSYSMHAATYYLHACM